MVKTSTLGKQAVLKNWKTTLISIIVAFASFMAFSPSSFGGHETLFGKFCKYMTLGGLAGLGITTKDFNMTGGSR